MFFLKNLTFIVARAVVAELELRFCFAKEFFLAIYNNYGYADIHEARLICALEGGDVVAPRTKKENGALKFFMQKNKIKDAWLSLAATHKDFYNPNGGDQDFWNWGHHENFKGPYAALGLDFYTFFDCFTN